MSIADVLREYAGHDAERHSPLTAALIRAAAADWDGGGAVRAVLTPYADEPPGTAVPLRFTAALHRLVLSGDGPALAPYYPTVGGDRPPDDGLWPAARDVIATHLPEMTRLTGLPCQTNEVGRSVALLAGLFEIVRRTGRPVRLFEIGASAGLNLLLDRFRYGEVWGPPDSPCRLPGDGIEPAGVRLQVVDRAGCDPAPVDPRTDEGRLRLMSSVWGDQPERIARLRGALAVAADARAPVERSGAAAWLARHLPAADDGAATVVWHSVVRAYVDPAEWTRIEQLCARPGVWRLAYEPDAAPDYRTTLRLHGAGAAPDGDVLARGGAHGPPLELVPSR